MQNSSRCQEIDRRFPGLIAAIVKAHHIQSQGQARARRSAPRPAPAGRTARRK
jgi:hypothetical protein